jgi:hypothetical protein
VRAKHPKLCTQVAILAVFYTLETTCVHPNLCTLRQPNGPLLRALLVLRSMETSARRKTISCIIAFAPFANWSTVFSIEVGELF